MFKRKTLAALTFTALVSLTTTVFAEDASIRFAWWGNEARAASTLKVIKLFEEKNPGITVKAEYAGYDGYQARLSTQFAGGTEPDVMQVLLAWLPMFSKKGDGFADINQFSSLIDLEEFPKTTLEQVTVDGKVQGVPIGSTGFLFLYNKEPWQKAQIAYPKTWDELFEAAKLMRERLGDDYYPLDPTTQGSILISLSWAMQKYNVNFIDPNEPKVSMTEEQVADWLRFFKKLETEHALVSIETRTAMGGANKPTIQMPDWVEGKWGGVYSQDSTITTRADTLSGGLDQLEVGPYIMLPEAKTAGTMSRTGLIYSISKHSKQSEAAAKFINFLTTDPEAARIVGATRGLPASKTQWDILTNEKLIPPIQEIGTKQIMELDEKGLVPRFSLYFEHPLIYKLLFSTFEEISFGKTTPEEAAPKLIKEANRVLSRL